MNTRQLTDKLCELLNKRELELPDSLLAELEEIYIDARTEIALDDLAIAENIVRDYYCENTTFIAEEDIIRDSYIDDDRLLELLKSHYSNIELTKLLGKDL